MLRKKTNGTPDDLPACSGDITDVWSNESSCMWLINSIQAQKLDVSCSDCLRTAVSHIEPLHPAVWTSLRMRRLRMVLSVLIRPLGGRRAPLTETWWWGKKKRKESMSLCNQLFQPTFLPSPLHQPRCGRTSLTPSWSFSEQSIAVMCSQQWTDIQHCKFKFPVNELFCKIFCIFCFCLFESLSRRNKAASGSVRCRSFASLTCSRSDMIRKVRSTGCWSSFQLDRCQGKIDISGLIVIALRPWCLFDRLLRQICQWRWRGLQRVDFTCSFWEQMMMLIIANGNWVSVRVRWNLKVFMYRSLSVNTLWFMCEK